MKTITVFPPQRIGAGPYKPHAVRSPHVPYPIVEVPDGATRAEFRFTHVDFETRDPCVGHVIGEISPNRLQWEEVARAVVDKPLATHAFTLPMNGERRWLRVRVHLIYAHTFGLDLAFM